MVAGKKLPPIVVEAPPRPSIVVQVSGSPGAPGAPGQGVAAGGTAGQVLTKASATDYDTAWQAAASGGSTILSGTATPGAGTGNLGDYYLDTDDHILYGPKSTPVIGGDQSAWGSKTGSATGIFTGPLTYGLDITCAAAGQISALSYYKAASSTVHSHTLRVWNTTTQAQLGNATTTAESGEGWKTVALAVPIAVSAGQRIRLSVDFTTDLLYRNNGVGFTTGDLSVFQQSYLANAVNTYPGTADSGLIVMLDVVYQRVTGTPWPVAVYGVPPGGTTGQFLKKTSGTDYAVGWVT